MDRALAAQILRDTVAATESPGYNVMYGGSTFDDYSAHPAQYHEILSGPNKGKKSSAAGRYQYLKGTWDEWAPKVGVTDFSPESQDAVFDAHVADVYRRKTGRDIYDDIIAQGGVTQDMMRPLSGTWTSLKGGIEENPIYASSEMPRLQAMQSPTATVDDYRNAAIAAGMDVSQLSDDKIMELMQLGGIPDAQSEEQTMLSDALRRRRNEESPQGRTVRNGIYVAASPLEHLGSWVKQGRIEGDIEDARMMANALRDQQARGRAAGWDAYSSGRGAGGRGYASSQPQEMQPVQAGPASIGPADPMGTTPEMISATPIEDMMQPEVPQRPSLPENRGGGDISDLYGPTGSPTTSITSDIGAQQAGMNDLAVYGPGFMNQSLEQMPNTNQQAMPGTGSVLPSMQTPGDILRYYQTIMRGG